MTVKAKICGVSTAEAVTAAVEGGAAFIGLVFYPPSPRYVSAERAAELAAGIPPAVRKVGLFVDEDDATIEKVLARVPLDMLQLHGDESPARVRATRARFGLPVMKAIKIAGPDDPAAAEPYADAADWLLFDAKAPAARAGALPGGNALMFDWQLLAGRKWPLPWMLSGGLTAENVAAAVSVTGAAFVDVSSGVEDRPGRKSPTRIAAFLRAVAEL